MLTVRRENQGGRNGGPSCRKCGGTIVDASEHDMRIIRCINCGWRAYDAFDIRGAQERVARCACGAIIQKTGRISTDKCDDCLRLWRSENTKLRRLSSRRWRNS